MLCDDSKSVTVNKLGERHFRLRGTNGSRARAKNERFTAAGSDFVVRIWQILSFGRPGQKLLQKPAARAARLFFFIQPIKSLICGVVVVVAVVIS